MTGGCLDRFSREENVYLVYKRTIATEAPIKTKLDALYLSLYLYKLLSPSQPINRPKTKTKEILIQLPKNRRPIPYTILKSPPFYVSIMFLRTWRLGSWFSRKVPVLLFSPLLLLSLVKNCLSKELVEKTSLEDVRSPDLAIKQIRLANSFYLAWTLVKLPKNKTHKN